MDYKFIDSNNVEYIIEFHKTNYLIIKTGRGLGGVSWGIPFKNEYELLYILNSFSPNLINYIFKLVKLRAFI